MYTKRILYLSMGTGLYSDMSTYGGGLEILAGDTQKGVIDSKGKYPMTFIHLLWKKGYVYQTIDSDGHVRNEDPKVNDWEKYVEDTGVTTSVDIFGGRVLVKIWKLKNGPSYFLDVDLPENKEMRNITDYLYGGAWHDREKERIAQEIVLGIGGVRAAQALGLHVDAYHYNDGHPVFAGLELISQKMKSLRESGYHGDVWQEAFRHVKSKTYFTTHTNVPAGNESHPIQMMREVGAALDLADWQLEEIGGSPFNMTVASLNLSCRANGVSRLQVLAARKMWKDVKHLPPIIAITNGVHSGTWQDKDIATAFNRMDLDAIYTTHMKKKVELINAIEERCGVRLSAHKLTIAFARRATEYKRWLLILKHSDEFKKLIFERGAQIIFAGKAHRYDTDGQKFIEEIYKYSKLYPNNIVFLEGYDIELAQKLVSGVDVWLNNPRVPLEACGTSGMKAAMNGVLNLSTLDGWWREGCIDRISGWAIPTPVGDKPVHEIDDEDARNLMKILNYSVAYAYKNREEWKLMMFASIVMSKQYDVSRMLEEYFVNLYGEP